MLACAPSSQKERELTVGSVSRRSSASLGQLSHRERRACPASYRSLRRFWPTMQSVIETAATQPGLIAMAPGVDRVLTSGTSISFWRSPKDAMAFGYRHPSHAAALERSDAERWLTASFMARFGPYASSGAIHGVDPLAAILTNKESMQSR